MFAGLAILNVTFFFFVCVAEHKEENLTLKEKQRLFFLSFRLRLDVPTKHNGASHSHFPSSGCVYT